MKIQVRHKDGPAVAMFEYEYQAEIFACEVSKVHRSTPYEIAREERLCSTWIAGRGHDHLGRRVRVVRS